MVLLSVKPAKAFRKQYSQYSFWGGWILYSHKKKTKTKIHLDAVLKQSWTSITFQDQIKYYIILNALIVR